MDQQTAETNCRRRTLQSTTAAVWSQVERTELRSGRSVGCSVPEGGRSKRETGAAAVSGGGLATCCH